MSESAFIRVSTAPGGWADHRWTTRPPNRLTRLWEEVEQFRVKSKEDKVRNLEKAKLQVSGDSA